ncbi:hypothetical protein WJX74_005563 [Apatococcus lobatus]|uniref:SET domain-containing protein n=1 Tax=Apatococcus lobatus TaxID=904363 RepID=A0AAW1RSL7_9CHLO
MQDLAALFDKSAAVLQHSLVGGRYLVAKHHLEAGDVVLQCPVLLTAQLPSWRKRICYACHRMCQARLALRCKGCEQVWFCSPACQDSTTPGSDPSHVGPEGAHKLNGLSDTQASPGTCIAATDTAGLPAQPAPKPEPDVKPQANAISRHRTGNLQAALGAPQVPHQLLCPVLARFGSAKCGADMLCVLGMVLQLLGLQQLAGQAPSETQQRASAAVGAFEVLQDHAAELGKRERLEWLSALTFLRQALVKACWPEIPSLDELLPLVGRIISNSFGTYPDRGAQDSTEDDLLTQAADKADNVYQPLVSALSLPNAAAQMSPQHSLHGPGGSQLLPQFPSAEPSCSSISPACQPGMQQRQPPRALLPHACRANIAEETRSDLPAESSCQDMLSGSLQQRASQRARKPSTGLQHPDVAGPKGAQTQSIDVKAKCAPTTDPADGMDDGKQQGSGGLLVSESPVLDADNFPRHPRSETSVGRVLFLQASFFNHSCHPNCYVHRNPTGATIIAMQPIAVGQELTISYIDEQLPQAARMLALQRDFFFRCNCSRCSFGLREGSSRRKAKRG